MESSNKDTAIADAPLLIKVTLVYDNGNPSDHLVESFLYYNDEQLSREAIESVFFNLAARGPFIAPRYGLPQLAPVDMPDMAGGAHHPYSFVDELEITDAPDDETRLDDASDFLMFSKIYPHLRDDTPCSQYIERHREFHTKAALKALDTAIVHMEELNLTVELVETMKKSISQ